MNVIPKVLTAEFFRKGLSDRIRCSAIAPGYVGTPMVKDMNQKALDGITAKVPIGRLIEPEEVASLACEMFRNEAMAGDTFFIHGGSGSVPKDKVPDRALGQPGRGYSVQRGRPVASSGPRVRGFPENLYSTYSQANTTVPSAR